jgi:hypothetical protein
MTGLSPEVANLGDSTGYADLGLMVPGLGYDFDDPIAGDQGYPLECDMVQMVQNGPDFSHWRVK